MVICLHMLSQCPMGMLSSFTHHQLPTIESHDYFTNKLTSYIALTSNNIQVTCGTSDELHQRRRCGAICKFISRAQAAIRHGACDKSFSTAGYIQPRVRRLLDAFQFHGKQARKVVLPTSSSAWEAAARPALPLPALVDSSSFTTTANTVTAAFTAAA
jgi:hypothetical protein